MSDTAKPEYCSHCGRQLGPVRTIIVGSEVALHPNCVEAWQVRNAPKPPTDTSAKGWWATHEHYDRDGYCDNPARGY